MCKYKCIKVILLIFNNIFKVNVCILFILFNLVSFWVVMVYVIELLCKWCFNNGNGFVLWGI